MYTQRTRTVFVGVLRESLVIAILNFKPFQILFYVFVSVFSLPFDRFNKLFLFLISFAACVIFFHTGSEKTSFKSRTKGCFAFNCKWKSDEFHFCDEVSVVKTAME